MSAIVERLEQEKTLTARDCDYWQDGRCERCGVPWQYFEVSADYKCKGHRRAIAAAIAKGAEG